MVKDWVLKVESGLDGDSLSYLDMMERHSAEERRRAREREIMEEGKALWMAKKSEELELEHRDQEQIREMSRSKQFGRPGHGAPTDNIRKKKFTEYQLSEDHQRHIDNSNSLLDGIPQYRMSEPPPPATLPRYRHVETHEHMEDDPLDVMTFGRPGCGAPVRTRSGRLRTTLVGSPEIRFQNNESVQKTIYNTIRYQQNKEDQGQYKRDLEEQIDMRRAMEKQEKERDVNIYKQLALYEGDQWGRPGPGGTYWRPSAVTGQNFFDKMGWCGSADPRKRNFDVKQVETLDMKKDIIEHRQRTEMEHQDRTSNVGVELVPLLKEMSTGKPRKDPTTGYMMSHSLSSTDVTKSADPKRFDPFSSIVLRGGDSSGEKKKYHDDLYTQVAYKESYQTQRRKEDQEEQKKHFENWETFWGRSGHGAPQTGKGPHKENLMRILHYPTQKSPNSVELITLERLPVK